MKIWQTVFSFWDLNRFSLKSNEWKHTQFQAFLPGNTNFRLTWFRAQNLYPISGQKNPFSLGHPYCKSSINPPPLSQISSPSNKPLFSFKPLFPSPPLPSPYYSSLIYDIVYLSITTVTLHVDWSTTVFFTSWTFRFVFYPRLHDLQPLYLSFYTLQF